MAPQVLALLWVLSGVFAGSGGKVLGAVYRHGPRSETRTTSSWPEKLISVRERLEGTFRIDPRFTSRRTTQVSDSRSPFHGRLNSLRSLRSLLISSGAELTYSPLAMYTKCLGIVGVWMALGTMFYSYCNDWPLPQSFFYAVDAGMSIGFCTDVAETKLTSKAFTVVYILLGASVVTGALSIVLQDALEGLSSPSVEEYQVLVERKLFEQADLDRTGKLNLPQFHGLLLATNPDLSQEDIIILWKRFDRLDDGVIYFEEFSSCFRSIDQLILGIRKERPQSRLQTIIVALQQLAKKGWKIENRIHTVCITWILIGIVWGMCHQKWDFITAIHFAVSALATGGLTAPPVNSQGILPAAPSIFCGVYCLFGIPLFALTLAHFATSLVAEHVQALERTALTQPMSAADYEVAKHLTTTDSVVHLSDFIVLQLLRQGKLSRESIKAMKSNFEDLDSTNSGTLTLEEAISPKKVNL